MQSGGGGGVPDVAPKGRSRFATFLIIWFGQLTSTLGSALTGFALGVWVYQTTGSVTQFALISLFTSLPGLVLSPIAGALVDRWNRRTAMILSDAGAGLCTLAIALLIVSDRLELWHIYLAMAISSVFNSVQWPAYSASVSLLVPKEHYGRASGLVQIGQAVSQILAPVLGAVMLVSLGIYSVILLDFASALVAIGTLLAVRIPQPASGQKEKGAEKSSLLKESRIGWTFIKERPGLMGLVLLLGMTNLTAGMVHVLFTPLVLSLTDTTTLGTTVAVAGVGMLLGTVVMSAWGGPKQKVVGVIAFLFLEGIMLVLSGLRPSLILVGACAFVYMFSMPIVNGCSQAIWLAKTPHEVQGRVFAVRRMIAWSMLPISYFLAGPLSDRVFEPLMAAGGFLASSVGLVIGYGPGRGIALLYIVLGVAKILVVLGGALSPTVRRVEEDLPDVIQDEAPIAS